jgi:hypothetical protein
LAASHHLFSSLKAVQVAVVDPAKRHSELITDLAAKGARLPEPNMMGIGGRRPSSLGDVIASDELKLTPPAVGRRTFPILNGVRTDGTNLPSWLHFNPLNRTFSGTAVTGTTAVRVTARDQWGKTVTDDFNITIS